MTDYYLYKCTLELTSFFFLIENEVKNSSYKLHGIFGLKLIKDLASCEKSL